MLIRSDVQVPRRETLSAEEFQEHHLRANQPVVLTGEVPTWPAFSHWSQEYFTSRHGQRLVQVNHHERGLYTGHQVKETRMSLAEFFAARREGPAQSFVIQDILTRCPWLIPDYRLPRFVPAEAVDQSGIWLGPGGTSTGLHWDSQNGLLALIRGRKRIWLFSPDQHEALYPCPLRSPADLRKRNWSDLDVFNPAPERFPRARGATYLEVALQEGEMIFIPENWWHAVRNEEGLQIAVNFWLVPGAERPGAHFYHDRRLLSGLLGGR
ncbi:cupin-like domain-containing protein [Cystobacter fuscus]|uniref:cupin-like domain-containing protein n=1 Tax=Cystobacter fuscus TaxID=43 RepID=UPI0037BF5169